jgi:hypothetical protein
MPTLLEAPKERAQVSAEYIVDPVSLGEREIAPLATLASDCRSLKLAASRASNQREITGRASKLNDTVSKHLNRFTHKCCGLWGVFCKVASDAFEYELGRHRTGGS